MSRIMIVDDEWAEREGMKYLIKKTGLSLEVEDAPNGAAALERLQQGAKVDILMTDIEMPFMDGLELCQRARTLRPEMKTVIFSAHSQFEYAQRAIDAGVTSYMLKPVRASKFEELIFRLHEGCQTPPENACSPRQGTAQASDITANACAAQQEEIQPRKIIRKVQDIIEAEYGHDIGLESIAEKVYLTPCYLSTLFKKEMKVSLVNYIRDYRMQRARELLRDTTVRVADIGRRVGYTNLPYFYTVFKNQFGMTPVEFREQN